jgi:hypothetical protein
MNSFMHQHTTRPTRLLLACLLGHGLAACGGECRDALLGQAKTGIARGDTKAAIIQFNNAVVAFQMDAGDIQYHYAAALAISGDKARARQELDHLFKAVWTSVRNLPFRL